MRRALTTVLTGLTLLGVAACGSPDPTATTAPGGSAPPSGRLSAPPGSATASPPGPATPEAPVETHDPSLDRPDVLAALLRRGGMCPDGPCGSSLVVTADGTWVRTGVATAEDGAGRLSDERLGAIRDAVAATRLGSAPKFEGTCPTASDGQEVVVYWRAGGDLRTAASCTVQFPDADPLLRTLQSTLEDLPDDAG